MCKHSHRIFNIVWLLHIVHDPHLQLWWGDGTTRRLRQKANKHCWIWLGHILHLDQQCLVRKVFDAMTKLYQTCAEGTLMALCPTWTITEATLRANNRKGREKNRTARTLNCYHSWLPIGSIVCSSGDVDILDYFVGWPVVGKLENNMPTE